MDSQYLPERNIYEYDGYAPRHLQLALEDHELGVTKTGDYDTRVDIISKNHVKSKFKQVIDAWQRNTEYNPNQTLADVHERIQSYDFTMELDRYSEDDDDE